MHSTKHYILFLRDTNENLKNNHYDISNQPWLFTCRKQLKSTNEIIYVDTEVVLV